MTDISTPRPWYAALGYAAPRIYDSGNKSLIVTLERGGKVRAILSSEAHANAALIVKAVNAHDGLVMALRDIAGGMNTASPSNSMLELGPAAFHQAFVPLLQRVAREALDKVETIDVKDI